MVKHAIGKRYNSLKDLRSATRKWCEAEFERRAGYKWNANDAESLRDDVSEPPGLDAWMVVEAAIEGARRFLDGRRATQDEDGYTRRLRHVIDALPTVVGRTASSAWTVRKALVLEYDGPNRWWWRHGKPMARDLAILSMLAGQFPDWARKKLESDMVTVMQVVAAEERAIRQARKRANE